MQNVCLVWPKWGWRAPCLSSSTHEEKGEHAAGKADGTTGGCVRGARPLRAPFVSPGYFPQGITEKAGG